MNLKITAAAVALAFVSLSSFAAGPAWPSTDESFTPSSQTRANVRAEYARASSQGELGTARLAYDVTGVDRAPVVSPTRAQVRADFEAARARGDLDTSVLAYGATPVVHGNGSHDIAVAQSAARAN